MSRLNLDAIEADIESGQAKADAGYWLPELVARVRELEAERQALAKTVDQKARMVFAASDERDAAIARAEQAEARVLELEAQLSSSMDALRRALARAEAAGRVNEGLHSKAAHEEHKRVAETMKREQAERAFLECARAAGIYYAAEGHDDAPGPLAEVVKAIEAGVSTQHDAIEWELHEEELAALREVAEAARYVVAHTPPGTWSRAREAVAKLDTLKGGAR